MFDKIVDSTSLDAGITKICDAIRRKTGGTGALAFPDGIANAVDGIRTGGGLPDVITAGDTPVQTAWGYAESTDPNNYAEVHPITVKKSGTYRVRYSVVNGYYSAWGGANASARIFVNHAGVGTENSIAKINGDPTLLFADDLPLQAGDVVTVGIKSANSSYRAFSLGLELCINWEVPV